MAGQRTLVSRVLVVGGGLAGLALAVALGRVGVSVEVVDVTDQVDRVGIGLIARVIYALDELGVLDECRALGWVLPSDMSMFTFMFDAAGKPLTVPPVPVEHDPRLPGVIMMYRPELIRILREHATAAGAALRFGATVHTTDQTPDEVEVVFTDGRTASYDLVVGADGVRSLVRRLLHGRQVGPNYIGHTSLRWVLADAPRGPGGFYCAKGSMVAVSQLPGGLVYMATGCQMPQTQVCQPEAVRLLRQVLDRYSAPHIVNLRKRLTGDQEVVVKPYEWVLVERPWHRGRITVIGDAAHATAAHLSSSGGIAIEDAVVLAQELTRGDSVAAALEAFERRRIDRVRLVVSISVELLRMQLEDADPLAIAAVRNRALAEISTPY